LFRKDERNIGWQRQHHWSLGDSRYYHVAKISIAYPEGFSKSVIETLLCITRGSGYVGNRSASGTEIIIEWGDEYVHTGFPIVYS
jgi:phosphopentomutase